MRGRIRAGVIAATMAASLTGGVYASSAGASESGATITDPTSTALAQCTQSTIKNGYPRPTTSSTSLNCTLSPGAKGAAVKTLQRALAVCYRQQIAVDGHYGPITRLALANAQKWENARRKGNITVDGLFGPETTRVLKWLSTTKKCGYPHG